MGRRLLLCIGGGTVMSLAMVATVEIFSFLSPIATHGHYFRYLALCAMLLLLALAAAVWIFICHYNLGVQRGRAAVAVSVAVGLGTLLATMWPWSLLLDLIYGLIV